MTLIELNNYFNSFLKKEDYAADISLNGIQIQNKEPDSKQITKVAFAVDACETTAKIAAEQGAQALFVHHGLFWGQCQPPFRLVTLFHVKTPCSTVTEEVLTVFNFSALTSVE